MKARYIAAVIILAASAAGVLYYRHDPGRPASAVVAPPDKLSALNAEIEASLRNPNPGEAELQKEMDLLMDAAFYANDFIPPDSDGDTKSNPKESLDASRGKVKERSYDLPALEARFVEAMQLTDLTARRAELEDMAAFLAANDPETAARFMRAILDTRDGFTDADGHAFASMFADEYAKINPEATARWCEMLPEQLKYPAHQLLTMRWTQKDPGAVDKWMQSLPGDGLRSNIIRMMGQTLAGTDSSEFAAKWAADLATREKDGPRMSDVVVQHWAAADIDAAAAWAAALPNPDDRDRGVVALAKIRTASDAPGAAAWVRDHLQGDTRTRAMQEVIVNWCGKDPAAVAAWIDKNAEPALLDSTFDTVALSWMKKDEASASAWIDSASVSAERKAYLIAVARQ